MEDHSIFSGDRRYLNPINMSYELCYEYPAQAQEQRSALESEKDVKKIAFTSFAVYGSDLCENHRLIPLGAFVPLSAAT
jgi:hypothetical protein